MVFVGVTSQELSMQWAEAQLLGQLKMLLSRNPSKSPDLCFIFA